MRRLGRQTYHPAQPQAGLAGCAQGDVGGGDVRRGLQRLDLPGGLAGRAGAHDVYLTHAEPEGEGGEARLERRMNHPKVAAAAGGGEALITASW